MIAQSRLGTPPGVTAGERMVRWVAARPLWPILLAAPTLVFPGPWTSLGLALILVAAVARWIAVGGPAIRTPVDTPVGLIGLTAVVGLLVSPLPSIGSAKLWGIVLGISVFYAVVVQVTSVRSLDWGVQALSALGVAVAAVGAVAVDWSAARIVDVAWLNALYAGLPTLVRGLPSSGVPHANDLINAREVGGTLALLLPLAAVRSLLAPALAPRERAALLAAALVMGVVLLLTQTISAIGGVAIAIWLSVVLLDRRRRWWWVLAGLLAMVAVVVLALTRLAGVAAVSQRVTEVTPAASEAHRAAFGLESRLELWPRALMMIHDAPYTGVGLNSFRWVMDRFYSGYVLGPEPHAHNFLLQTGVDLGLPGLVAVIWLFAGCALTAGAAYVRAPLGVRASIIVPLAAGLLAHLLFGTIDAITLGAKPGFALWVVLGLLVAAARTFAPRGPAPNRAERHLRTAMLLLLALALLAPLAWGGPRLNAGRILAQRGLLREADGVDPRPDLAAALPYLDAVSRANPRNSSTWYLFGISLAHFGEDDAGAAEAMRKAAQIDADRPLRRYARGLGAPETAGRPDWAGLTQVYGQWMARYPRRAEWYLASAIASCEGLGQRERALEIIRRGQAAEAQPARVLATYLARIETQGLCPAPAR